MEVIFQKLYFISEDCSLFLKLGVLFQENEFRLGVSVGKVIGAARTSTSLLLLHPRLFLKGLSRMNM